jgi:hypothetical protein
MFHRLVPVVFYRTIAVGSRDAVLHSTTTVLSASSRYRRCCLIALAVASYACCYIAKSFLSFFASSISVVVFLFFFCFIGLQLLLHH